MTINVQFRARLRPAAKAFAREASAATVAAREAGADSERAGGECVEAEDREGSDGGGVGGGLLHAEVLAVSVRVRGDVHVSLSRTSGEGLSWLWQALSGAFRQQLKDVVEDKVAEALLTQLRAQGAVVV